VQGFPRTVSQAEKLDAMVISRKYALHSIVELVISSHLISRVNGRLIHLHSECTYHKEFKYVNVRPSSCRPIPPY
jgi:adenylate kinase